MRSTLHLVDAADYPAFDAATAEARVANWRATARRAGISLDDLHARLLDFCDEPRTVAEIEPWIDTVAPGIGAAAPAGVRNTAFRAASAGGGLVHIPPSGFFGTRDKPSYVSARAWLRGVAWPAAEEALQTAVARFLTAYGPVSAATSAGGWDNRGSRASARRLPRSVIASRPSGATTVVRWSTSSISRHRKRTPPRHPASYRAGTAC
jgi:hypothetical protein